MDADIAKPLSLASCSSLIVPGSRSCQDSQDARDAFVLHLNELIAGDVLARDAFNSSVWELIAGERTDREAHMVADKAVRDGLQSLQQDEHYALEHRLSYVEQAVRESVVEHFRVMGHTRRFCPMLAGRCLAGTATQRKGRARHTPCRSSRPAGYTRGRAW